MGVGAYMIDYVHRFRPSTDSYSRNWEVGSMGVGAGLYMYDVVVKKFMFAISSPDEFLLFLGVSVDLQAPN